MLFFGSDSGARRTQDLCAATGLWKEEQYRSEVSGWPSLVWTSRPSFQPITVS